ncbi:uncharacterized protein LOC108630465 isoform X3 [Ceratina calcarata]|uniref:Uncharacterized protein LOC108630465 isoform X3 n=1 Tax=Ceratina calcarata TaxID=156304 RepID=A0AAJ7SAV9_9HYME|nr:uncharacterized protein LOC108630465 isoform X3 [Ceratina calcarata]
MSRARSLSVIVLVSTFPERAVANISVVSTATEDVGDGLQGHENDTEPLQLLSQLEAPMESVYMICGVSIALVLVGIVIVLLAVTISKLRKREDHHHQSASPATIHPATVEGIGLEGGGMRRTTTTIVQTTMMVDNNNCTTSTTLATTETGIVGPCLIEEEEGEKRHVYGTKEQFVWQFPPPYPPVQQYGFYNDQESLVHSLPGVERNPSFAKGIRKNIGRWRRLVRRKPETDCCAIPPELKDQLKTIYVY